jgi:hypothetical protein
MTERNEHPTTRELDLLWNQGITPLRKQLTDVKQDIKDLSDNIASARRLIITILVTSIPAYATAFIAFFALKK